MRVVVTGGNGFLGSHLNEELTERGYSVVSTCPSSVYNLTFKRDTECLIADTEPDAVIHLAAKVGGIGANKKHPATFAYQNLMMGANIVEACHVYGVKKLVIAGTICAYPKYTQVPFSEDGLWEGYPEKTNAPYGLSKKMLLVLAQAYRQEYGHNFIYLLPVNLYGPRDNFDLETSHVIPAMIRKFHTALHKDEPFVTLWGDGTPTREFLYVKDCAKAFAHALEKYDSPEPVNIGSGTEISMISLATKIKDLVGYKGEIRWDTSKPNGQPRRCLDVSMAKECFGWEATTSFDAGLSETYKWFLEEKADECSH